MIGILELFNEIFSFYVIFPSIVILGGILTWKLKGLQFSGIKNGFLLMLQQNQQESGAGSISRYEAVSAILAGNFGTGNIVGMAVALTCGGPGALVWVWVAGLLGAAVQLFGSYLGIKYRYKEDSGEYVGGPIACLYKKIGSKSFASLFCLFTIVTAVFAGNAVQVSSIVSLCSHNSFIMIIASLALMFLVIPVILKGNDGIVRFSAKIIPFVAVFYFVLCFVTLGLYSDRICESIALIFSSFLGTNAFVGGIGGYTFSRVLSTGVSRAIMATDCGSGMVSLLQTNSKSKNPVIDGMVTLVPPFIVLIVCTLTTLVLLVTGAYTSGREGASMVLQAFSTGLGSVGSFVVMIAMFLFGYTTILTWFVCAEKGLLFLTKKKLYHTLLKVVFVLIIPFGGFLNHKLVWSLADIGFIGMVVFNSLSMIGSFKEISIMKNAITLFLFSKESQSIS